MKNFVLLTLFTALFFSCANKDVYKVRKQTYRQQYHFTPSKNWMNDPNGMFYKDGWYHLFFQYNPFGNVWGHMSWGHAKSKDLIHWEHMPLALAEENGIMIFSGSAVVDYNNTSGFGANGKIPIVAIYTGFDSNRKVQQQSIAYSLDDGTTWTKYANNPVLDLNMEDFRDPKVFWYAPDKKWVMTVSLAKEHKIQFYSSTNLIDWQYMSDFGPTGEVGGVWECPDLFEVNIENEPTSKKWVLEVDLGEASIAGGSGGQFFVGHFDGKEFVEDDLSKSARKKTENRGALWIDYGKDFYAAVTWSNTPNDEPKKWIGWMNNWQYAQKIPTSTWRSTMSLARSISLKQYINDYKLMQVPIDNPKNFELKKEFKNMSNAQLSEELKRAGNRFETGKWIIDVEFKKEQSLEFHFAKNQHQYTSLKYDPETKSFVFDRTNSGITNFSEDFPGSFSMPYTQTEGGKLQLTVYVEQASIEIFFNQGEEVMTNQIFPKGRSFGVDVIGDMKVNSMKWYKYTYNP